MSVRMALASALAALTIASPLVALAQHRSDADTHLYHGDALTYEGDYYRAITEYKLFLSLAPRDPERDHVRLRMAWLYAIGGEQSASASILRDVLITRPPQDRLAAWSLLHYAQMAQEAKQSAIAQQSYERVIQLCADELEARPIPEEAGRVFLGVSPGDCAQLVAQARIGLAAHFTRLHRFDDVAAQLKLVPEAAPERAQAQAVATYLTGLELPEKSPVLAGVLSIIPGVGHFYLEEYGTGITAMAWNGIFIYALVDSILSESYGQAALIGLLELVWYSGTIFGAVGGAHRFNRDARRIVEEGAMRDLSAMGDPRPWTARFPMAPRVPKLQLELSF